MTYTFLGLELARVLTHEKQELAARHRLARRPAEGPAGLVWFRLAVGRRLVDLGLRVLPGPGDASSPTCRPRTLHA